MASQPPPDIDPPAAESQETQANPDDGSAARREKTREFWKTRIRCTLRIAAAAGIEADIANVAASHPHFVRAFELAANDYALVVPEVMGPGMPPNPTDRFFKLWERDQAGVPGDDPQDGFVPIDAKSFCYTVAVLLEEYTYGTRTTKHLRALIHVTPRQVRDCQALIISSLDDGNWVAFVPRYYYQLASQTLPDGSKNVWLGSIPVAMARINPLPPILAPFVMHKKNLAEAFDNMLAHVQDGAVRLRNPHSGLEYRNDLAVETRSFDVICPPDDPEIKLRYRIWKAFEDFGGDGRHIPEYRMRNTICCPWTSDIRLDHKSGTSIFIELKEKHARVSADQKTFSHLASGLNMPGKGIFTFRAPWDYILTMVDDDTGYLMIKEDIPKDWWHNYPGGDGWLTHVYPNNVLLSSRRVSLNQPAWDIVRNIRRIIIGTRIPGDPPVKSRMTAKDICRLAGPCHMALLSKDYMDRMGLDDDDAGADEGAAGPHAARALATRGQADDGEPEEAEGRRRGAFGTVPVEDRYKLVGGLDATVDAQLFMPLMDECRRTGKGCMIDLGKFHPFGRMAMVRYNWSDQDRKRYDRTGRPPCWAGMLGSNVSMVVLASQWARWRINYAPDEGTVGQVELYRRAHPCLVVCHAEAKELGHKAVQRWVVPSEFMPMIQVGDLKAEARRAPLIMEQQRDIEQFIVAEARLHATVYEFLSGKEVIHVGFDRVAVNPAIYLKTIRDYKALGESEFDRCRGPGIAWNRVEGQLQPGP